MATSFGVGESWDINSFLAGKEAAEKALQNAGCTDADFAFVFMTVGYNQQDALRGMQSVLKNIPMSGCSGEGIITQSGPNEDLFALAIMVIKSDEITFHNVIVSGLRKYSYQAGETIAAELKKNWPENPLALFLFPDGLAVNTKALFTGIEEGIPEYLPFLGGISADNMKMLPELNFQYHNGQVYQDAVACVLMSGQINMEIGVTHGCIPLGIERVVTKAKDNLIYTIDHQPAFDALKEFSDEEITGLTLELVVHLCFGESMPDDLASDYGRYIIRTPLSYNVAEKALVMPTEMLEGTKFMIMRRDPESIIANTKAAAFQIKEKLGEKKPYAVLHFNCMGRGKVLFGRDTQQELDASRHILGNTIPWLGFYCYGEIAPVHQKNYFHNYTSVQVVFYSMDGS